MDNQTSKLARRRTTNRPTGTFARFLDALISYDFAYFHREMISFTTYKENLAAELSITARHLARLLSGQTPPEIRLLTTLSKRFPHIKPEGWIPKLTWDCFERDMELLPNRSVITFLVPLLSSGDVDALAPVIVRNMARAIISRKFKFVYLVAPLCLHLRIRDELSPVNLIDRLRLRILSSWLEANPNVQKDLNIEKNIANGVCVFETKPLAEAGHFWSFLPRYAASSNLLADEGSVFAKHQVSVLFDSGCVPYSPTRKSVQEHVPDPVGTGGWAYMESDYESDFRKMFKIAERVGLFTNPERKNQKFPKPS